MARVTKINVGGTNYDIAHEGELKNSGFEVVNALPTTNLFVGRQVTYNGQLYVYNGGQWTSQLDPKQKFNSYASINSSIEHLNNQSKEILLKPYEISQIPTLLSGGVNSSLFEHIITFDDALIEKQDANSETWIEQNSFKATLTLGQKLRITAWKHNIKGLGIKLPGQVESLYVPHNLRKNRERVIIEYLTWTNATGDNNIENSANYTWWTVYDKELDSYSYWIFPLQRMLYYDPHEGGTLGYNYILNVRVSIELTEVNDPAIPNSKILGFYIYTSKTIKTNTTPVYLNYDAVIKPTQSTKTYKTIEWVLQYLTQAVNWLKANNVLLSAYNTKIAALEQADSDNNASIQSVSTDLTELSNSLATVATSGSYNDLTDKPTFSGSYNDLTDKPTLFSGSYDDLTDKPTIPSSFSDLSGTISSVQIPDGLIANAKLANSSMSLNGTTVNLGDTAILPWYVDYNEVDYPARIKDHWLQIYRNGVWANLMYLGDILPTQVGQITSLDNLDWYNEQVSEYEVDSNTTTSILNGTTLPATVLLNCLAEKLTLNLYPISGKQYGKGSLDSLISDLQGKGFSVFVENDLDTILQSGSDYLVRIKISKVPTPKAIIECYVAK